MTKWPVQINTQNNTKTRRTPIGNIPPQQKIFWVFQIKSNYNFLKIIILPLLKLGNARSSDVAHTDF